MIRYVPRDDRYLYDRKGGVSVRLGITSNSFILIDKVEAAGGFAVFGQLNRQLRVVFRATLFHGYSSEYADLFEDAIS
ncbi:hypothetical protein LCGC14_0575670 [marine sediment metagenome]|uniref:Uncharacterized protein n=1 Tax=marine sediment metagenome TaxID=412755 RepID=A0A0F9RMV9_9ZZZZ